VKLDLEQVRHVAKLARLSLTQEEEQRFSSQLSAVLDAVDSLAAVNTEGVPVTTLATFTTPREDEVREELPVDVALKNAPQKHGHSFAIPKVIE
jgi:aspartyl-tRNA(Asn)/glutamyl-tRNA(Gln) amidotransferase subunit C